MPLNTTRIQQLLAGYVAQTLSSEEEQELFAAIAQDAAEFRAIAEQVELPFTDGPLALEYAERQGILEAIFASGRTATIARKTLIHRVHLLKPAWFRSVAAAAIILLFGIGAYLYITSTKGKTTAVVSNTIPAKTDVPPGGNKAILTLANGSTIVLDSAANGHLSRQGYTRIEKTSDGSIEYIMDRPGVNMTESAVSLNTMSTPKGGQYELRLPDGTKIWLNAASSITYPTAFVQNIRTVKIAGEAYFEVSKNRTKPFIVQTYKDEIKVLGTHFNVNAYTEDSVIKTSLLEGRVQIGNSILQPGQAFENGKIVKTDIQQDAAWRNGLFNFNQIPVDRAMRQVARWYDVDVVYDKGPVTNQLYGKIYRKVKLQELLTGLEGEVAHFRLEGRTVHVTPL